jgi:hypothetical protein
MEKKNPASSIRDGKMKCITYPLLASPLLRGRKNVFLNSNIFDNRMIIIN